MIVKSTNDLSQLNKNSAYDCLIHLHPLWGGGEEKIHKGFLIFDWKIEKTIRGVNHINNKKFWFLISNSYNGVPNRTKIPNYDYSWVLRSESDFLDMFNYLEIVSEFKNYFVLF
jgi:hypothetical protein